MQSKHLMTEDAVAKRPAGPEDFEFARNVHHAAYHDVVVRQFGAWDTALQDHFFLSFWNDSPPDILFYNGERCGYISIEETSNSIELHELVLLPAFQRKGIGGTCMRMMIDSATKKNIPIHLQVLKENIAAELYRRVGFEQIGENENHYQMEYKPRTNHP